MGTWGAGSFENDDASDWVSELVESGDGAVVSDAINSLLENVGSYLDAPNCSVGLAAAEVVAATLGRPSQDLPQEVKEWVAAHRVVLDPELKSKARQAVAAVAADSELKELWQGSDEFAAWQGRIADLSSRLG